MVNGGLGMNDTSSASNHLWRDCPVCGTERGEPHFEKRTLRVVRCSGCGMLFANPVAAEFAEGSFYDRLAAPYYLSPDKLEGDYAPVRFARELRLFRRFNRGGSVLDVGCSTGAFLHQLAVRFPGDYTTLGTDVAGPALDYAGSRGVPILRTAFLEHDFGGQQFDAVTFWAVLEHVAGPRKFLAKAAALLKPGGHCFVLVPNMRSLAARCLGTRYRYIMDEHLNYFTAATLRRFVAQEHSFTIAALKSTHFNPLVLWQDWRGGDGQRVPDSERARLLKRTTGWKQNPLLAPVRWIYAGIERGLGLFRLADNLVMVLRRR
jgi:2-polyprenyl-3-methyl-5-hydroxy-6-metoxy-1,4-benzoquinol methylase